MAAEHSHAQALPSQGNKRRLQAALALTSVFLVAEVIGAIATGSLALLSDAAHMFTDTAALTIALAAIHIGKRPADDLRTFGYERFEILAAAFNALLLFAVAGYILFEAYQRLKQPPQIESLGMLVVATIGLVVNLVSMRMLSAGKDKSLNVKGAYLEVWSDLLGSIGVIGAAIVIRLTGWAWIDSAIAVAIGLWVLPRTWTLLKETSNVLLEGVPAGVNLSAIRAALASAKGVQGVHDLHLWAISSGQSSLTAHIVQDGRVDVEQLLGELRERLQSDFEIHHTTLQIEREDCRQGHKISSAGAGPSPATLAR